MQQGGNKVGKQIGLIADKNDLYDICSHLQKRFSRVVFMSRMYELIDINSIIQDSLSFIYIIKDKSMLPSEDDKEEIEYFKRQHRVELFSFVRPGTDTSFSDIGLNGRIYVMTYYFVGDDIRYTDKDTIKIYESAARYIKSHCHSKYRLGKTPYVKYCMPCAYKILTRAIEEGKINPEDKKRMTDFLERWQEIVVNP